MKTPTKVSNLPLPKRALKATALGMGYLQVLGALALKRLWSLCRERWTSRHDTRKRRVQRGLTLIEVVMSFGLAALLLSALLFLASSMWRSQHQLGEQRKLILSQELLWTRLEDALGKSVPLPLTHSSYSSGQLATESTPSGFSWDGKQLTFSFRPLVSDVVQLNLLQQARLFVRDDQLIFETGPTPLLWPEEICRRLQRERVWLEGVDQMNVRLLYLPELKLKHDGEKGLLSVRTGASIQDESEPEAGWNDQWLMTWHALPAALAIEIVQNGRSMIWPVWLQGVALAHYLPREGGEDQGNGRDAESNLQEQQTSGEGEFLSEEEAIARGITMPLDPSQRFNQLMKGNLEL